MPLRCDQLQPHEAGNKVAFNSPGNSIEAQFLTPVRLLPLSQIVANGASPILGDLGFDRSLPSWQLRLRIFLAILPSIHRPSHLVLPHHSPARLYTRSISLVSVLTRENPLPSKAEPITAPSLWRAARALKIEAGPLGSQPGHSYPCRGGASTGLPPSTGVPPPSCRRRCHCAHRSRGPGSRFRVPCLAAGPEWGDPVTRKCGFWEPDEKIGYFTAAVRCVHRDLRRVE